MHPCGCHSDACNPACASLHLLRWINLPQQTERVSQLILARIVGYKRASSRDWSTRGRPIAESNTLSEAECICQQPSFQKISNSITFWCWVCCIHCSSVRGDCMRTQRSSHLNSSVLDWSSLLMTTHNRIDVNASMLKPSCSLSSIAAKQSEERMFLTAFKRTWTTTMQASRSLSGDTTCCIKQLKYVR
jgi:hypothetical protein